MRYRHIGLFVFTALLGAALGHSQLINPYGLDPSGKLKPANNVPGNLLSGNVTCDQGTPPWSVTASALPLPAGASTAARQDTGNASLASIDGKLPALAGGRVPVDASGVTLSGTVAQGVGAGAAAPWSCRLTDGTAFYKGTTPSDTQPVSAAALPLPAGASTSALQTAGNATLTSIDGKLPTLSSGRQPVDVSAWFGSTLPSVGQKTAAQSIPVIPASDWPLPLSSDRVSTNGSLGSLNATVTLSCAGVGVVGVGLRGTFTATVTFERTTDGTTWGSLISYPEQGNTTPSASTSSVGVWFLPCAGYLSVRLRVSAYTSGTISYDLVGNSTPRVDPIIVGGYDGTTPRRFFVDNNGRPGVAGSTSYSHITGSTTTNVVGAGATLRRVVVNSVGLSTAITIYDNTSASGSVIAVIGGGPAVGTVFEYNVKANNGITIDTTGSSGALDLTVITQ